MKHPNSYQVCKMKINFPTKHNISEINPIFVKVNIITLLSNLLMNTTKHGKIH